MLIEKETISFDLAGIIVGDTSISDVQGDAGILAYRGIPIEALVDRPFLQVAWLLVFGTWPTTEQEQALTEFMALHRRLSAGEIALLEALPKQLHPMLVLQSVVPTLGPAQNHQLAGIGDDAAHGLAIAAKIPAILAAWHRISQNLPIIPAMDNLLPHDDFLRMFHGKAPSKAQLKTLDTVQILQLEHSFNAGTFAGRVCASTQAPLPSVLSASIGTLYGVLHGGADQAALAMARQIGTPDKAEAFIKQALADKQKIMGMGHREYNTVDPRAAILKPMAIENCTGAESKQLLETLCAIEDVCQVEFGRKGKQIWANVEFYKGAVFHSLGIPDTFFTAMFAMARVYGYLAHYLEFKPDSRLIRPRARYVGTNTA